MEECSPTCSSTPIKDDEDKTCRTTDDTNTIDTNLIDVGSTYDYNISNQIIMNQETTEKVMKILDESMQAYDEDGQLESLKDIGRIQVSFVFEGIFFNLMLIFILTIIYIYMRPLSYDCRQLAA